MGALTPVTVECRATGIPAPFQQGSGTTTLTAYCGDVADFLAMPLQGPIEEVAAGLIRLPTGRVFHLDDIVEAHRTTAENRACGKIVVLTR